MPGAARDRGRRRAASGNSGRGAPTAEYRFIECRDGVRIEHPQHATVDLRAWADGRAYGMTSDPGYVQRDSVR